MLMIGAKKIVSLLSAMAIGISATAQGNDEVIELSDKFEVHNATVYTIDNGLTSSGVTCIERDKTGFMWIGTNDGVNSFDGYSFKNYVPDINDSTAISGRRITAIKEIENNKILMSTADGALSVYDKRSRTFSPVSINVPDSITHEFNGAYGIGLTNKTIYVGFGNYILKIDKETQEQGLIGIDTRRKFPNLNISRMKFILLEDGRNMVIQLNNRAFGVLNIATDEVEITRWRQGSISDICAASDNEFYLCTTNGLKIYNISTGEIKDASILQRTPVQSITKDANNNLWLAYDNNHLMKWMPSRNITNEISNIDFFLNKQTTVYGMIEDENQVLWMATSNTGLIKLDVKRPKIHNLRVENPNIPKNYITHDFCAINADEVWAACGIYGILKINTKTHESEHMNIPERVTHSLYVRRNGEIIIGTMNGALRYTPNRKELTEPIEISDEIIENVDGRCTIHFMTEDCLGNLWFATQVGLYKYNGMVAKRYPSASHGTENVNVVYEDAEGRIWSGTESGSFVMEPGDSIFHETLAKDINKGDNNYTYSFADNVNSVLIGTSSGVLVYDKETKQVRPAQFNKQFGNATIYSIVCDDNGIIWISTNRGIGYIDRNNNQSYLFNHHDGLTFQGNECHKFAKYKDHIYIGNATNMNYIIANHIKFNDVQPTPFVSDILYGLSGKEMQVHMENDTLYTTKYMLKASLKVHVASSDYTLPSRNEFMYKIDNEDWTHLTESNEILISSPMPSTIKVQVKASNGDKVWGDTIHTFYIKIVPPLWLSNTAIAFYIIVLLAASWFLINLRFRSIKQRMKQMEGEARAKKLVEAQRNRLAKLHKDQEDSIRYAKRIQESLMPPANEFERNFSKLFVFYMPKDIVSGDFYSIYERDDKTFIIAADCTGHGVPGAFISILGIDHLYNIIMRQKIDDAGQILTYLHRDLHDTIFSRDSRTEEFNEGMDLTICVVYHKEKKINFAGAMNDLYLIRDNEILTYHGDRHSIGTNSTMDEVDEKNYISQTIDCQKGDMFYMFSDGFVDQFGGPELKKFKHRRFKQLLLYMHKLPAKDQRSMLNRRFMEWKGNNEQTDDVSVIGFEPWE